MFMNIVLGCLLQFVAVMAAIAVGQRLGRDARAAEPESFDKGYGAVEGAVFALLGLVIAFTFSGAAARFDARRSLVLQEANAIGTAYLRVDLLPVDRQPAVRDLFRRYADARIAAYVDLPSIEESDARAQRANTIQAELWRVSIAALATLPPTPIHQLVVTSLNDMIDVTSTRYLAARTHPPLAVWLLMGLLSVVAALLAGYDFGGAGGRRRLHGVLFATVMAGSTYVILDMEYPRFGLIRVDDADAVLRQTRDSMGMPNTPP